MKENAISRPDLNGIDPAIIAYIEALEAEITRIQADLNNGAYDELSKLEAETSEAPTTEQVITITRAGIAKRTARHLYSRQRRGGMGIYDLNTAESDPPAILCIADQDQSLLCITNFVRAFRTPVSSIQDSAVRDRGNSITARLTLNPEEHISVVVPIQAQGYLALVSQSGMIRTLRHHIFGEYMKPGMSLYDMHSFGPPAAACWTGGDTDLFIATRLGRAIRFSHKSVPPQGCLGMRINPGDEVVAITAVYPDSNVFMLGADGKGTTRCMSGFLPNKAPGSSGKYAMTTGKLVTAISVDQAEDIFIISQLSKIIRFPVADVPVKEGVVQGVNCMAFRADEAVSVAISTKQSIL